MNEMGSHDDLLASVLLVGIDSSSGPFDETMLFQCYTRVKHEPTS